MNRERYSERAAIAERRRRAQRRKAMVIALALAGILAIGGTVAWITTSTDTVRNLFSSSKVTGEVTEEFEENDSLVKENVAVKNTGDIPVYVRAKLVVNWVSVDGGSISAEVPVEGQDYTLVLETTTGWDIETSDGFYYYTKPVDPGSSTGNLVGENGCKPLTNKDGYQLKVDVIASVIQAEPTDAVKESWGVDVGVDGTISK